MEASCQSEGPEQICNSPTLLDGIYLHSETPNQIRRLVVETGPKGCLSDSADLSGPSEVSLLLVAEPDVTISVLSNLRAALEILVALGFMINYKKSVFQPTQAGFPGVVHRLAGHDVITSPWKAAFTQDSSSTGALIESGEGTSPCQFARDDGGSTPCNPPCPPKLPHSGEGNDTVSQEGCNIQGCSGGPTSHRPTTEAHCGSSSGTGRLREMHH